MALDVAGNSVLTVGCADGLWAMGSEAARASLDRRTLCAIAASLVVHGMLMALPCNPFSAVWDERSLPASASTGERLEVFMSGAVASTPVLQPSTGQAPNTVVADRRDRQDAVLEEFPLSIAAPQAIAPQATDYLSANDLDIHPSPENPIVVPFPESFQGSIRGRVILVLSISADGVVEQVSVDDSSLPPAFGQVASRTFLDARLRPGVKDGKPVAARMKILVEFEN